MSTWDPDELATIGGADEIQIPALRSDGSLRPYTTIWVVHVGDQPYGRSYRGRDGAWFRAVQQRPEGRVRAGGVPQQVRPVRQRLRRSDGRR